jgi:capsid portal protein
MGYKIFGLEFGKKAEPITQQTGNTLGSFAFSTPFMKVGGQDLSTPYINRYYTQNNIVRFGNDNLYPQLLNQLYYTSPIHGACIDFISNAIIGGGYKWLDENQTAVVKVEQMAFEKSNKFQKLAKVITKDFVMHRRVTIEVTRRGEKIVKFRRLDPATIRNDEYLTKFVFSQDWSRGLVNTKEYVKYDNKCKEVVSLYVYQEETPGQDIYPLPTYNSVLNWAYLDGEQSYFHKSNIQNGIFPSLAIRRPKEFGSIDEVEKFKEEISLKTGSANGGRVMVLTGNGYDDTPEIVSIASNTNDKIFEGTEKALKENISIGHKINPAIMGVKVSGSLGATTEINDSYKIFEKNVVMPERETITEILNDLIDIARIKNTIVINNYQIVDDIVVDVTKKDEPKI